MVNVKEVPQGCNVKLSKDRKSLVVLPVGVKYNKFGKLIKYKAKIKKSKACKRTKYFQRLIKEELEANGLHMPSGIFIDVRLQKHLVKLDFRMTVKMGCGKVYIGTENTWRKNLLVAFEKACALKQEDYAFKHNVLQQKLASVNVQGSLVKQSGE